MPCRTGCRRALASLALTAGATARPTLGDNLLAVRKGQGSQRVMLLGHADTVFPVGTAAARPLTIQGNKIMGPGTCDMKAGLLTGIYAIEALDFLASAVTVRSIFFASATRKSTIVARFR